MKKTLFFAFFFIITASVFANNFPTKIIYIEGTAERQDHRAFFMSNFELEATALGFTVSKNRAETEFTFMFNVQSHSDEYDPSIKYILRISLIENETGTEMVSFGWAFAELEDMYAHNQFLFHTATVHIPGISEEEWADLAQPRAEDKRWKNKWLYLRASADYPITFYSLQPTGLIGGQGAYTGTFEIPSTVQHMDHKIMPQPGLTVGAELQFLDFMSLEINFQTYLGDPKTYKFFNMALAAQLKYNLIIQNFMLQPYGAFKYHLNTSSVFVELPSFVFGGGIQAGIKAGSQGIIFIDVNFMLSLSDVYMHNPFGDLAPLPEKIHYKMYVLGIGAGYKFGLVDKR